MGYTTEFQGRFELDKELDFKHAEYLKKFSDTRRMKRDPEKASRLPDITRMSVGLDVGKEGGYFVGGGGLCGQGEDFSIVDYNHPPINQPGLWCQWVPSNDRKAIVWDGNEKFYCYEKWLIYIIDNFLKPWGYTVNGTVQWRGESFEDIGTLIVENNVVSSTKGW